MNTVVASKVELIRTINDRCRRHFLGCQVMVTPSVQELLDDKRAQLLQAVRAFDKFDEDSDDEAKYLAPKLRMDTDELQALPRGTFGTFVRDLTPRGIKLQVSKIELDELPKNER
jgi:hypothetical protein